MREIIAGLKNLDGITLKNGKEVRYKSGWQVGLEGTEATTIEDTITAIEGFGGNCGVWLSEGVYYIDKVIRVRKRARAVTLGRRHKQQSIYGWRNNELLYC